MFDEHHVLHRILQVLGGFTNTSNEPNPDRQATDNLASVGHRILVVDDEPALRIILARAFRERGCETIEACDEMAALEAARSASPPFDLIVTNSGMPHLDGPHLAAELHQADPGLPIIHLFCNCFKPFNLEDLLDEADTMMRSREPKPS